MMMMGDEMVIDHSISFITSDMASDDVHSASAVTELRTSDEFFTMDRLNALLRVAQ